MGILRRIAALFSARQATTDHEVFYQKELYNGPVKVNGEQYAHLPNPGPGLIGDYQVDPNRLFAPNPRFTTDRDQLNKGSGDPRIERTPDLDMTRYLKEPKVVDTIKVLAPAHGVFVPDRAWSMGWKQQYIPAAGMRQPYVGFAPPPHLSAPIRSVTVDINAQGKRVPTKLKAPPPNKGV